SHVHLAGRIPPAAPRRQFRSAADPARHRYRAGGRRTTRLSRVPHVGARYRTVPTSIAVGDADRSAQGGRQRQCRRRAPHRLRTDELSDHRTPGHRKRLAGNFINEFSDLRPDRHRCAICRLSRTSKGGCGSRAARRIAGHSRLVRLRPIARPLQRDEAEADCRSTADHRPGTAYRGRDASGVDADPRGDPAWTDGAQSVVMEQTAAESHIAAYERYLGRGVTPVFADLNAFMQLVQRWQKVQNLVSRETPGDLWHRHILDSLQILPLIDGSAEKLNIVDIGSGGGFPALPLALALKGRSFSMQLIESNSRKCAFLRAAAREFDLPIT